MASTAPADEGREMSRPDGRPTDGDDVPGDASTVELLRRVLDAFCASVWNENRHAIDALSAWHDVQLVVRMPDVPAEYTVSVDRGVVRSVTIGVPDRPQLLCILSEETLLRIDRGDTTAAIECLDGRITVRGSEVGRRRLLAALSFLTW